MGNGVECGMAPPLRGGPLARTGVSRPRALRQCRCMRMEDKKVKAAAHAQISGTGFLGRTKSKSLLALDFSPLVLISGEYKRARGH